MKLTCVPMTSCKNDDFIGYVNDLTNKLPVSRAGLMGVAIAAVIVYHLHCWVHGAPILNVFKWGFIGVDVFIFASAFGLCFSYEKNSLSAFYGNRFKRIFPLLVFQGVIVSAIVYFHSEHNLGFAIKYFLLYSTTLNYYVPGFSGINWFMPAIILLYLSFPIAFKIMASLKSWGGANKYYMFTFVMEGFSDDRVVL